MTVATHTRLDIRRAIAVALAALLLLGIAALPAAAADPPMPSTNEANRSKGWMHFVVEDVRIGAVDLTLNNPRTFLSCFEYRVNGELTPYPGVASPNPVVTDGRWRFSCMTNTSQPLTLAATEWVEVRSVFGPESGERFDWTRVNVPPSAAMMLDALVAAGGITPGLEAKIRNALTNAEAWLAIEGKEGVALSHYDRAIHLLLWQADVVDGGKTNQGDAAGLRALAAAIQDLKDANL